MKPLDDLVDSVGWYSVIRIAHHFWQKELIQTPNRSTIPTLEPIENGVRFEAFDAFQIFMKCCQLNNAKCQIIEGFIIDVQNSRIYNNILMIICNIYIYAEFLNLAEKNSKIKVFYRTFRIQKDHSLPRRY